MDQMIKTDKIDFKTLVAKDTQLSITFQTKMTKRLSETFTENEQKWYIAILYLYLNTKPKDFPINLENVYSLIGFAHKKNAKRTLENNFTKNEDYIILLLPKEQRKTDNRGGHNEETIMLNVETFKAMCMMSKTEKGKEIRKYYVKLENILNEIMIEERLEYQENLKIEKDKNKEQEQLLLEKNKVIEHLENKPETNGYDNRIFGYIYLVHDTDKPGHYKIGYATKSNLRLIGLNTSSSTQSLKLICNFETFDKEFAEKSIHCALNPFKISNHRNEWFYIKNAYELAYTINTMKNVINFIKQFDIKNYESLKKLDININEEFKSIELEEKIQQKIKEKNSNRRKELGQQFKKVSGNYKGTTFFKRRNQWKATLKKDGKVIYIGYYDTELESAKAYNNYALFVNNTTGTNYLLNDIENYTNIPQNIPEETKKTILENKSSKYIGVKYLKSKKFDSVMHFDTESKRKTIYLGTFDIELDAAKYYNQQALYYNQNHNKNYILNEIPDYITIPKDIYSELQIQNIQKKTSKYVGVYFSKQAKKFKSVIMYNQKQTHLGTFENEVEAAKAYNIKADELNKQLGKIVYKINEIIEN